MKFKINTIAIGESSPDKGSEQKVLENELICLMGSWRPDKERIKVIRQELKKLKLNGPK